MDAATKLALISSVGGWLTGLAAVGMLMIHCRRDRREFKKRPVDGDV